MTEFTAKDRERLKGVEDNVCHLRKTMDKFMEQATGPVGFPRCAARAVEWKNIHDHQKRVEGFITWFYRGLIGVALVFLLSEGVTYAKYIVKIFSKITPGEFP